MTYFMLTATLWTCAAGEADRWRIQKADGESVESAAPKFDADAISLERIGTPRPPWPLASHLEFVNGDRLTGFVVECDQRVVIFNTSMAKGMKVPLSRIQQIGLLPAPESVYSTKDNPKRDRVILQNGDRLVGSLSGILKDERQLRMEIDGKPKSLPLDQIASIYLNADLRADRVPDQPHWRCTLRDGSRLSLLSLRLDGDKLTGQTLFKAEVSIPLSELIAADQLQGKAIWLSSLKPAKFEPTPYLTESVTYRTDRDPDGGQLSLQTPAGLHYFDRGLSMSSKSALTYNLDEKDKWFIAEIGLDPKLGKQGHVDVKISIDGKPVDQPELKGLTSKHHPISVRVPLKGAKRLTLEVDWGEGGPVGDVVTWGGARVVR